jgi:hypothetical protein
VYSEHEIQEAWNLAHDQGIKYFGSVGNNAKTIKGDLLGKYLTHIMYLAPSVQAGKQYNVCPMASKGCSDACLFTAGRGNIPTVKDARIRRTLFWFNYRNAFKICIFDEIQKHVFYCKKNDKLPAVRLNGTSDIVWERQFPEMFDYFKDVRFYDYTKIWPRLMPDYKLPSNYHLTLSKSETNDKDIYKVIDANPKANVAVVFDKLPKNWRGRKVIDGDLHDLRILDPKGIIVGLKLKGDARNDETGFVVRTVDLNIKKKELVLA